METLRPRETIENVVFGEYNGLPCVICGEAVDWRDLLWSRREEVAVHGVCAGQIEAWRLEDSKEKVRRDARKVPEVKNTFWKHGKQYQCWTGGVVNITTRGKPNGRIPVLCNKWGCNDCGEHKRNKLAAELIGGIEHEWGERQKFVLLTLTIRARIKYNNDRVENWKAYRERTGLESFYQWQGSDDWTRESIVQELDWIASEYGTEMLVPVRAQFRDTEWRKYMSGCWKKFSDRYRYHFKKRIEFLKTMELTQQGIPHWHAVIPIPKDEKPQAYAMKLGKFAAQAWQEITKDSYQIDVSSRKTNTPQSAIQYVLKYVTKDLPRWDVKGMRRYDTSIGFPRVKVGDVHKFGWTEEDGEDGVFNVWEYEQSLNSVRQLTKQGMYIEALVNTNGLAKMAIHKTGEIKNVKLAYTMGEDPSQEQWEKMWEWMKHKDMSYLGPADGTPSRRMEEKVRDGSRITVHEFRRRVSALGEHIYRFNRRMMKGVYFNPYPVLIEAWEEPELEFIAAEQTRDGKVHINLDRDRARIYL